MVVACDVESACGCDDGCAPFLGGFHAEDPHDRHRIGGIVLDPHYQCDRTGVVEADVGTCTFDEYFCFGFVHGESRDQDASARSGLDCVFFQPFGGAVGINSHYFTFEFGFEGLCRYIPPPRCDNRYDCQQEQKFFEHLFEY